MLITYDIDFSWSDSKRAQDCEKRVENEKKFHSLSIPSIGFANYNLKSRKSLKFYLSLVQKVHITKRILVLIVFSFINP